MELSAPQNIFLNHLDTKFRAYVGGYGSGKPLLDALIYSFFLLNIQALYRAILARPTPA